MEYNYYDTFITVAADCTVEYGTIPPNKKGGKSKSEIEFELASESPYGYTQEELLFETHIRHKEILQEELAVRRTQIKDEFFLKPQPCLRASMLPKKYGWGIHFNAEGKLALVPRESATYLEFVESGGTDLKLLAAMRNSRK